MPSIATAIHEGCLGVARHGSPQFTQVPCFLLHLLRILPIDLTGLLESFSARQPRGGADPSEHVARPCSADGLAALDN